MTRRLARLGLPAAAIALSGCGGLSARSYALDHGVATYDGLKAATEQCAGRSGVISVRENHDGRDLSDYDCVIGKAR
jgi:hypothetical protein